jgi:hypothetical protein
MDKGIPSGKPKQSLYIVKDLTHFGWFPKNEQGDSRPVDVEAPGEGPLMLWPRTHLTLSPNFTISPLAGKVTTRSEHSTHIFSGGDDHDKERTDYRPSR